jgi:hypothetical protein
VAFRQPSDGTIYCVVIEWADRVCWMKNCRRSQYIQYSIENLHLSCIASVTEEKNTLYFRSYKVELVNR